jgi:hypothetical protein
MPGGQALAMTDSDTGQVLVADLPA